MSFEDNEEFKQIVAEFTNELPQRIQAITMLWSNYKLHMTTDSLNAFVHEVHKIAGTAGMIGFNDLGDIANDIQVIIRSSKNPHQPTSHELDSVNELMEKMNEEINLLAKITKDTP